MTVSAATLRRIATMSTKEAMAEMLIILADAEEIEEARKAGQRERTRRHRDRNVTVTSPSRYDERYRNVTVTAVPLKETPPTPPKENTPPFVNPETARARGLGTNSEAASSEPTIPAVVVPTIEAEFAEFWKVYEHRVGKPDAFKAFVRARSGEKVRGLPQRKPVTLATILDGVAAYIRDKPPDAPWLNPSTFLNQERYFDERAAVMGKRRDTTTTELADMLAQARLDIEEEEARQRDPQRQIAFGHG